MIVGGIDTKTHSALRQKESGTALHVQSGAAVPINPIYARQ